MLLNAGGECGDGMDRLKSVLRGWEGGMEGWIMYEEKEMG